MSEVTAKARIGLDGPSEPVAYKSTTAAVPELIPGTLDYALMALEPMQAGWHLACAPAP